MSPQEITTEWYILNRGKQNGRGHTQKEPYLVLGGKEMFPGGMVSKLRWGARQRQWTGVGWFFQAVSKCKIRRPKHHNEGQNIHCWEQGKDISLWIISFLLLFILLIFQLKDSSFWTVLTNRINFYFIFLILQYLLCFLVCLLH